MKPKILVVCGPTATGKSDKAVEIALERNGEIISADSRQVYAGLDIGSGKITQEEMKGVKHHLIDVANPKNVFSVEEFVQQGKHAIEEILQKGKLPIICGGTGYYIDALVYDIHFPEVAPNENLRKELGLYSLEDLQNKLQELDPERYEAIDTKNPVRLIRAIEIATELGKVPFIERNSPYEVEWIYLDFPDEVLKERIHKRLISRLENGMLDEAKNLNITGLSFERMKQLGLEYRYEAMHLLEEISYEEMIRQLNTKIWQFAKRQRTWFRKYGK
ncbi:MAG: tRNA delta(2)-isopentenylpyrophosphate transferase, tRNA dimethylallyltransferase [Candidatus Parcubacteria bacterium]|jgi:tRNA dimethylallyltransferase